MATTVGIDADLQDLPEGEVRGLFDTHYTLIESHELLRSAALLYSTKPPK